MTRRAGKSNRRGREVEKVWGAYLSGRLTLAEAEQRIKGVRKAGAGQFSPAQRRHRP